MAGCERELLEQRLTAALALARAAAELLRAAAVYSDGRLPSFRRLARALMSLNKAVAALEDDLAAVTGLAERTSRLVEEALGVGAR